MKAEGQVRVGIAKKKQLKVIFHSAYMSDGKCFVGEHLFSSDSAERLFLPADDDASFTLENVVIGVDFHWERAENQTFCGALQLLEESGFIWAVNILPVETYLTSVISSEMNAHAPLEFLKAHAVISRSWLLVMMQKSRQNEQESPLHEQQEGDSVIRWYGCDSHQHFDVCADDHCQRYQGIARQSSPSAAAAVHATRGMVLEYDGTICDARFSKCCGGVTELFESCWENVQHPYLIAQADPYCNTQDKRLLSRILNSYDQETSHFYRWTVSYTDSELAELIQRKSGIDFGRIIDLLPLSRSLSGRIVLLKIVGEKRSVVVGKELEIRKWLSESHLYSSAFEVEKISGGFRLHGKGWGHGVGLCQIGAAVMADEGKTFQEILQFYYPGSKLGKRW